MHWNIFKRDNSIFVLSQVQHDIKFIILSSYIKERLYKHYIFHCNTTYPLVNLQNIKEINTSDYYIVEKINKV